MKNNNVILNVSPIKNEDNQKVASIIIQDNDNSIAKELNRDELLSHIRECRRILFKMKE
ncbi:MAG: hypothetical protein ISP01_07350 [Methanobrevibacter arboriphilus]|uniref:Uncharacterized protein n=1 Tax=Methanobrevibacter arboriphilus TaxID=39441 RepID=A0A843ACT7_METAZ|nr:hypothetical protein [Methanobrevibacter arboriphilus]MBF4469207.1 hypothetical protein [Methanobrevibacter arboriphilus]